MIIVAAIIETFGSLLLLVGLCKRLAALVMSGEMAFAYFMVHAPKSFYPAVNAGSLAILYCFVEAGLATSRRGIAGGMSLETKKGDQRGPRS